MVGSRNDSALLQRPRWPARPTLIACGVMCLALACADVCYPQVNLSVLFFVPLTVIAQTVPARRPAVSLVLAMIVLVYVDYVVKLRFVEHRTITLANLRDYRMLNRSIVAATMALTTGMWLWVWSLRQPFVPPGPVATPCCPTLRAYVGALGAFIAGLLSGPLVVGSGAVLLVTIFVTDVVTPPTMNTPIMYLVPLLIVGWQGDPKSLYLMLLLVLGGNVVGFFQGPRPETPALAHAEASARAVAAIASVGVAGVLHLLIRLKVPVSPWR